MPIVSLDEFTEAELIDLHNRIAERLRLLQQMRAHQTMLDFRIGERVTFDANNRFGIVGTLTRYNKVSVTVISDQGERWNVAPSLLRKYAPPAEPAPGRGEIVRLKRK